jgi:hypothetical protein
VTDDALWVVVDEQLVRIDLATNEITSVEPIGMPAAPITDDGVLWLYGPVDSAPVSRSSLFSVDVATGRVRAIEPEWVVIGAAVGFGALWVLADGKLSKLDPVTTEVAWSVPSNGHRIRVACNELWLAGHVPNGDSELSRLDPSTGEELSRLDGDLDVGDLQAVGDRCWHVGESRLAEVVDGAVIEPGQPRRARIAGESLWTLSGRLIRRYDPVAGAPVGPTWSLDPDDLAPVSVRHGPTWFLVSAGQSLWLLNGGEVIRYDIPTD